MTPEQLSVIQKSGRDAKRAARKHYRLLIDILTEGHRIRWVRRGVPYSGSVNEIREDGVIVATAATGTRYNVDPTELVVEGGGV